MGREQSIFVGDKFTTKFGLELTVTNYLDCLNIELTDPDKNSRFYSACRLRQGNIAWSNKYGEIRLDARKNKLTEKRINRDERMRKKYFIGSVWDSAKSGTFEIISIEDSTSATIEWHSDCSRQSGCKLYNIKTRSIGKHDYGKDDLKPIAKYVYTASVQGEIVYVGKGEGKRYKHCANGASTNRSLNWLVFSGAVVDVNIYKDNLTNDDAKELEKQMIIQYKPSCNYNNYVDRRSLNN